MAGQWIWQGLAWLAASVLLAVATPAVAQDQPSVTSACHAYSKTSVGMADFNRIEWHCRQHGWMDGQPVAWLKFPAGQLGSPAKEFSSRITVFRSIGITAVDSRGRILGSRHYVPEDGRAVVNGAVFALELPKVEGHDGDWIVRIERPHSVTVLSEARLSHEGLHTDGSLVAIVVLTLVAGMLLTPFLFDFSFFIVLRERFVLLHAGMIVAMFGYLLFSGGLVTLIAPVPLTVMAILGPLSWALGAGIAGFFIRAFLEEKALTPGLNRVITFFAWWTVLVPGIASLQLDALQPFDNRIYFYGFAPVIPAYSAVILIALYRGSRAARFLAAAWAPIIIASAERLLRGIGLYAGSSSLDQGMFLAMGIEVIVITLGITDRFLAVRRERDLAVSEARTMEERAERDPLTGLFNRRTLEERFHLLRVEGFTTLAVIDLDHFKSVNDSFGHAAGDRVLQAVAHVLEPDDDTLAFRMGGEEFLLLMRGRDAPLRAENRRQQLPARIAAEVEGLDRVVTASMGLVEVPRSAMPDATFEQLYERADQLLYEAKQGGRNRTISERMRVFAPRQGERRKPKSAAA